MYQPNHIVPDEVHIDRLFPKCTPTYNQRQVQTQRRKTRSKKHYRRIRSSKSSSHIVNLASRSLVNDTSSEELCSNNHLDPAQEPDQCPTINLVETQEPTVTKTTTSAATDLDESRKPARSSTDADISTSTKPVRSTGAPPQIDDDLMATQGQNIGNPEEQTPEDIWLTTSQPNLARRSFTPPGFAQRIRHNSPPEIQKEILPIQSEISSTKLVVEPDVQVELSIERSPRLSQEVAATSSLQSSSNSKPEGQRVKFDDENLVSVQDFSPLVANVSKVNDKNLAAHVATTIRREHSPLMPIIKEDQNETELDDGRRTTEQPIENQPPESSKEHAAMTQDVCSTEVQPRVNQAGKSDIMRHDLISGLIMENFQSDPPSPSHIQYPLDQAMDMKISPEIDLRVEETIDNSQQSNLRHHRLPNESSHYSLLRATCESAKIEDSLPRFSNLQFNSLSEVDSEIEDSQAPSSRQSGSKNIDSNITSDNHTVHNSDPVQVSQQPPTNTRSNDRTKIHMTNGSSSVGGNQTGITATTSGSTSHIVRRAVIFPCLDDGLSSEPESCEDDIDDDYERGMDADVEADDDDDDDGGDEDVENTLNSLNRLAIQSNMYSSTTQQRQQQRQAHRQTTSSRQMQRKETLMKTGNTVADQSGLSQMKIPGSAYYSNSSQEPTLEANKQSANYPDQNGHWVGTSNQPTGLPSRNSSSQAQAFNSGRSNLNANSIHCADNKDEVKAVSRLSSDTDNETDRLLGTQRSEQLKLANNETHSNNTIDSQPVSSPLKQNTSSKEVLIEGVLFNVKYLGSTHNECEGRSEKEDRILQAEMAVKEVKFRNGVSQPAVEVQLFISTEKIMVLDDKHRKIMMDHSLRTISYIADIGDAFVLIVRKKNSNADATNDISGRTIPKISCHVFESSESHTITKSISQAFQVAYAELIKANGTGDSGNYLPRELDYQEVLNSQEMSTDEIEMFARKENQREVIVPKNENEILGVSIVESGWGSMLPTVVIASLKHDGPAYRCKKLSIGDVILSVNGISMVGLSLAECQKILGKTKSQRVAQLTIVPCPITVEVKIKRPDTKYQLGFSVQNGVICSLLRGGIAERGGVRVGHRIMSINGTTVVGVPHEKIVTLLASSVGEIRMKTCLTSIYRHMTGEENPVHL